MDLLFLSDFCYQYPCYNNLFKLALNHAHLLIVYGFRHAKNTLHLVKGVNTVRKKTAI